MQIQYDGGYDAVEVADLADAPTGVAIVNKGEAVEVPVRFGDLAEREDRARRLLSQADNWLPADAEARTLLETMARERDEALAAEAARSDAARALTEVLDGAAEPSKPTNKKTTGPDAPGKGN